MELDKSIARQVENIWPPGEHKPDRLTILRKIIFCRQQCTRLNGKVKRGPVSVVFYSNHDRLCEDSANPGWSMPCHANTQSREACSRDYNFECQAIMISVVKFKKK